MGVSGSSKENARLRRMLQMVQAQNVKAAAALAAYDAAHTQGATVASAAALDLRAIGGAKTTISGSVTITSIVEQPAGQVRRLTFSGAPLLTYNATSLKLPGAASIRMAAGDQIELVSLGSGNWEGRNYVRAALVPITTADQLAANVRLTLTSGVPITSTDVTLGTVIYATPYRGNAMPLYDGTAWTSVAFSEMSIKTTDAQTGTTANGSAIISGLTDTSKLMRGMLVTGTNVGAAAVISSINSATQVTVSVNSTGNGTNTITFKTNSSSVSSPTKPIDIFCVLVSGSPTLRFGNSWTNATTRADAVAAGTNGVYVNTNIINSGDSNSVPAGQGTYLGTMMGVNTGDVSDDIGFRHLWNNYNRTRRRFIVEESTASWTYSTAAYRQARASVVNQVSMVVGLNEDNVQVEVYALVVNSTATPRLVSVGIGLDSTTVNNAAVMDQIHVIAGQRNSLKANCVIYPGIGWHYLAWLEYGAGADTQTWTGLSASSLGNTGMVGFCMG